MGLPTTEPGPAGGPAVELVDVDRDYQAPGGPVRALRGITLRIDHGAFLAVRGPSGSGKTTLLNLITGLDRPTKGEVFTLGEPLHQLRERRLTAFRARNVGLVFQDPHLLPGLTALENVVVSKLTRRPRRELVKEAEALLAEVGLQERIDFPPALLSGGERQRVGIARALLGNPALLVADEPTGNLDAGATDALIDLLRDLRVRFGPTLVIATHDPVVAAAADRSVLLVDGVVQDADPTDVIRVRTR
jgi:putative ABC transport system ATP-binding protein